MICTVLLQGQCVSSTAMHVRPDPFRKQVASTIYIQNHGIRFEMIGMASRVLESLRLELTTGGRG
jgi:hypothetical protein